MKRNLQFEQVYPHPPERVWRALTDPKALGEWFMPNSFEARVGHVFEFRTAPAPGFDGVVHCQVIEVDEPRRLVYTWHGGWTPTPTLVTWSLDPVPGGTRLRLDHTNFEGIRGVALSMILGNGWKSGILPKLGRFLDNIGG